MCGIIGFAGHSDPKAILLQGLKRLEYRGYDSSGIAIRTESAVELYRSEGKIARLEEKIGERTFSGTLGIGHTRWATHGAPTESNAHPHRVGEVTLVHNGIIENFQELKRQLKKAGYKLKTETDSEVVAACMDQQLRSGLSIEESLHQTLRLLEGAFALVLMCDRDPDLIIGVRKGPPLLVGVGDKENFLASDVQAVLGWTNNVVYLEDGQIAFCRREKFEITSFSGEKLTPKIQSIDWDSDELDRAGYEHYMLKEIFEQPVALSNTLEGRVHHPSTTILLPELVAIEAKLRAADRIILSACGTALHAAQVGKYHMERLAKIGVETEFASEFRYREPVLTKNTLLVLVSQSGETADTLAALRFGKERGAKTISICNVRQSSLARESDVVLYTDAGPEIGVASTKAFTTQVSMLYMLALHLGRVRGTLNAEASMRLAKDLLRLPLIVEQALRLHTQVKELSERFSKTSTFFYAGRGPYFPLALEGALKLKEVSYVHAEGYPAGELKHGPIALLDNSVVTLALCPFDRQDATDSVLRAKMLSNIHEMRARGAKVIGIGSEGDTEFREASDHCIELPAATHWLNPIVASIPIQLFAYYSAHVRGCEIDQPRNLAKSVTVE